MASVFNPFDLSAHTYFHIDLDFSPRPSSFPVSSARDESDGPLARLELSNGTLFRRVVPGPSTLICGPSSSSSSSHLSEAATASRSPRRRLSFKTFTITGYDAENQRYNDEDARNRQIPLPRLARPAAIIQPFTPPRTNRLSPSITPLPTDLGGTLDHADPIPQTRTKRPQRPEPKDAPDPAEDDEDHLEPPPKKQNVARKRRGGSRRRRSGKVSADRVTKADAYKPSPLRHSVVASPEPEASPTDASQDHPPPSSDSHEPTSPSSDPADGDDPQTLTQIVAPSPSTPHREPTTTKTVTPRRTRRSVSVISK